MKLQDNFQCFFKFYQLSSRNKQKPNFFYYMTNKNIIDIQSQQNVLIITG